MKKPKKRRTKCAAQCQRRRICTLKKLVDEDGKYVATDWCCATCTWN